MRIGAGLVAMMMCCALSTAHADGDGTPIARWSGFYGGLNFGGLRLEDGVMTSAPANAATTAFWVEVANGRANAVAIEDGARRLAGQALTPHPDALPLTGLVPVLARTPKYRAPFLNGYMIHLDDEGWVWYFSPLGGEALPRVRAVDGAAWPYRRAK